MFEVKVDNIKRFENMYIEELEKKPVEKGKILFIGSSGFTRWNKSWGMRPLEDDIVKKDGSKTALNHGFGGSTAEEVLYYYDRLVKPYEPSAIVLRVFPNDIGFGYMPDEIMSIIARILKWARVDFEGIKLYVCDAPMDVKHIGNESWHEKVKQFNSLLKEYCDSHVDTSYICHSSFAEFFEKPEDVGDYSKVRQEIFVEDGVHFNQQGYDIYRNMFLAALDELL